MLLDGDRDHPGIVKIPVSGAYTPSFAKSVLKASPLNRIIEQGAPGSFVERMTMTTLECLPSCCFQELI